MIHHLSRFGLALALLALCTPFARAQAPDVGDYYEDSVEIGFKVRVPEDWEFTPPRPGEDELIGKYTPAFNKFINLAPSVRLFLEANLVKFDRRADDGSETSETEDEQRERSTRELKGWIEDNMRAKGLRVEDEDEQKIHGVEATEFLFESEKQGEPFHVFAMLYHLEPGLDVALILNGPADRMKWRKYYSPCRRMARSFSRLEIEEVEYSEALDDDSPVRARKRGELEAEVQTTPGWQLYETPNYFIISDVDDRQFIRELQERIEAIRDVYEELYPWAEAERIQLEAAKLRKEAGEGDEAEDGDAEDEGRTTTEVSSRELSRCSVLRVFKNQQQYHEYGGRRGSAGYWHHGHEELVIYDDKAGGGRRDTWIVLNHEAFHQYIFYLYGKISPHSWYNEGTGDFFSGYEYKHRRFNLKPNLWRKETIKTNIKSGDYVPLEKLVRFTQREYYGTNDFETSGLQNYAQGWSFIYFLRTGEDEARLWDDSWNDILDVYFETLAATGDLDEAVDVAFAGVDWQAMEEAWKAYILD